MKALVITAPGINCDLELCEAFDLAGCEVTSELLSRLSRDPSQIDRFDLIGLPGGFSYGDDIAAGRIMAALIRESIYPALAAAPSTKTAAIFAAEPGCLETTVELVPWVRIPNYTDPNGRISAPQSATNLHG
jgi:phosphoribosylformylglycinamidine (FGAM) synthase-like amidotransferase family enzyme